MKKIIKYFALFLFIGAMLSLLWSCFTANTPPSYQRISMCFERDKKDILLIKEYLFDSGYTDFFVTDYIDEDWKIALVDLDHVEIRDDAVLNALQRLKEKGYKSVDKSGDTVSFKLWTGIRPISCGIAFVLQGTEIDIQYVTETRALEQNEWYYYITDYNEWRRENTT